MGDILLFTEFNNLLIFVYSLQVVVDVVARDFQIKAIKNSLKRDFKAHFVSVTIPIHIPVRFAGFIIYIGTMCILRGVDWSRRSFSCTTHTYDLIFHGVQSSPLFFRRTNETVQLHRI